MNGYGYLLADYHALKGGELLRNFAGNGNCLKR